VLTITLAIIKLLPLHPSYVYRAMAIPTAAMAPMAPANGVAIGAASSPSPVEVASPPLVVSSPPPPLPPVVSVAVSVAAVVVSAVVVTVVVSVPDEELEVGEVTVSVLTETETEGETETLMVEDSSPVGTVTVSVADEVKPPSGLVVKTSPPGRVTTVGSTGRENWRLSWTLAAEAAVTRPAAKRADFILSGLLCLCLGLFKMGGIVN